MFYDHSNTVKVETEWSLRKEHMLMVCLSLHGTSRCQDIAKYELFAGYEQRHLHLRTKNVIRFHSVKPLQNYLFDIYMIRDYFLDAEEAELDGFLLDKHNRYYHPTMSVKDLELFFLQFQLTPDRTQTFERLRGQLNQPVFAVPDFSRHKTIEIIVMFKKLEDQLA